MATSRAITEPVTTVRTVGVDLSLTIDEARALMTLLRWVRGDDRTTAQQYVNEIYEVLCAVMPAQDYASMTGDLEFTSDLYTKKDE